MSAADLPPDEGLPAAELALGLADGSARAAAEARLATDPAFAADHAHWLSAGLMLAGAEAEPPPPDLWERVRARLPANDGRGPGTGLRDRGWLAATGMAATFVAGLVGGHLFWGRPTTTPAPALVPQPVAIAVSAPPPLLAVLTNTEGRAVLAVGFTPERGRLTAVPVGIDPGDRVMELWVIPAGGQPHAMGVLPHGRSSGQPVAATARRYLARGATLAVSLEPAGGSPTGLPTGPVILTGTIAAPT